jgi:hypothetical protein
MPGTERKLVYRQKNKPYMEDRTKAEVQMKKLVKCKPSRLQTGKRHVQLRISSTSDSVGEMIAHLSDGNKEAECLLLQPILIGPIRRRMGPLILGARALLRSR